MKYIQAYYLFKAFEAVKRSLKTCLVLTHFRTFQLTKTLQIWRRSSCVADIVCRTLHLLSVPLILLDILNWRRLLALLILMKLNSFQNQYREKFLFACLIELTLISRSWTYRNGCKDMSLWEKKESLFIRMGKTKSVCCSIRNLFWVDKSTITSTICRYLIVSLRKSL